MDFYYFSLCHVCKKPSSNLKKCGSCKILYYCSRKHQMSDWLSHKALCKVISKTNSVLAFPANSNAEDVNRFKYSAALLWQCEIGRPLDVFEHHMWMFPKMCAVCYSRDVNLTCQVCLSVGYCSAEHQEVHRDSHEQFCQSLKLCLIVHQTLRDDNVKANVQFEINAEVRCLPATTEGFLNLMHIQTRPDYSKDHINYIVVADFICPMINVIHALEKSDFIQNRQGKREKLVIHIVGPDRTEIKMCGESFFKMLSHWIFNLKSVQIYLIGPDVQHEEELTLSFSCEGCGISNFIGTIVHVKSFYHNFVHFITKPDLVVAFNSGLHEFTNTEQDTWKESIPKLILYKGVPVLLTAYTETELKKDIERFPREHLKFFFNPQRNPYSNMRPIRNWEEGSDPVYYQNGFVAIIAKK